MKIQVLDTGTLNFFLLLTNNKNKTYIYQKEH